ncbi:DNA-binding protein [Klebsiella pneumoniae]|nr:DNA-binding protein [Klebsiella pneumoniae]
MTTMPQRESTIAVPDDRRKQLGAFLRARRESLDPQRLGLPRVGRRRTPGSAPGRGGDARRRRRYLVHLAGAGGGR